MIAPIVAFLLRSVIRIACSRIYVGRMRFSGNKFGAVKLEVYPDDGPPISSSASRWPIQ